MQKAIVVGGGPAGLSAAIGLVRSGFSVRLFEQRKEWTGRVCGAFLSPEASLHLEWLGLGEVVRDRAAPVTEAALYFSSGSPVLVPISREGRTGLAISRKELEELLLDEARSWGVLVDFGARVLALEHAFGLWQARVQDMSDRNIEMVDSSLAVAADGRFSMLDGRGGRRDRGWLGWNVEFEGVLRRPGALSLHFFSGGYVGLLTFPGGLTNVSGLILSRLKDEWGDSWPAVFGNFLRRDTALAAWFAKASPVSPWRGVGALPFGARWSQAAGLFPAGDAAAVCDPFMGEGIARALSAGPLIARTFGESPSGATRILTAQKKYRDLWSRRYHSRPRLGRPLRWLLSHRWTLEAARRAFSSATPMREKLLSVIHGGG